MTTNNTNRIYSVSNIRAHAGQTNTGWTVATYVRDHHYPDTMSAIDHVSTVRGYVTRKADDSVTPVYHDDRGHYYYFANLPGCTTHCQCVYFN